ncbi:MAG: hypothetical protein KME52_18365 [Desmonostoc geniculatum HA4340-LM1]|jgi:hypothetical protein|nr:hypothetical protein [Desmonostoc geniculatum HA4340-LM1]
MKIFCTPADAILNLTSDECLVADMSCCEEWSGAVQAIALPHQISYSDARKAIVDRYRSQRVLSLYGICQAIMEEIC